MMWNMSAPLPTSLLGILISTVDPGSLLGPLFIAYNISQRGKIGQRKRKLRIMYRIAEHSIGYNTYMCQQQHLEREIERLKVALQVLQLDESRGVDGVPVHEGARSHNTAERSGGT